MGTQTTMEPTVDHRYVQVDGIGYVHYVTAGQGPPLVMLHGLSASYITWYENISALSERYTVYAPDLPGHGETAKPDIAYDLETGETFVQGFLDALGLDKVVFVGNSIGGLLAWVTALRQPERCLGLILSAPVGIGRELAWSLRLASIPVAGALMLSLEKRSKDGFMKRLFSHPERVDPAVYQELQRVRKLPGHFRATTRSMHNGATLGGVRPSLVLFTDGDRSFPVPTLVTWGEGDRLLPVEQAHKVVRLAPGVEVHVWADCGHWPHMENADEFNRVTLDFLERINRPGQALPRK